MNAQDMEKIMNATTIKASCEGSQITAILFNGDEYAFFRRRYERKRTWNIHVKSGLPITHHWAWIDGRRVPKAVRALADTL